jgi:remodeling and spacing factor 1
VGKRKKEKSEKKPRAVRKRKSEKKPKVEKRKKTERKPRKAKPTRAKKQIIRDDTEDEMENFGEEFDELEEGEIRLGTVLDEREELMDEELLEEELMEEEKEVDEMLEEELLEEEVLEEEEDDEFLAMKEAELALQQAELAKAKEKKRQKREAKKLEKKEQKKRGKRAKKVDQVESLQPVLSTPTDIELSVQKSAEIVPELSKCVEPPPTVPPIVLPVVSPPTPAKRKGRGRGKATLAAAAADTTSTTVVSAGKLSDHGHMGSTPLGGMASSHFPGLNQQQPHQLPFSTQPPHSSSSVVTRMLQSQPVSGGPQSFTAAAAAMGHKYFGGPGSDQPPLVGPGSGNSGPGPGVGTGPSGRNSVTTAQSYSIPARGRIPSPYRQPPPLTSSPSGSPGICLPHYASPRGSPIRPPPPGSIQQATMSPLRMRTPGSTSQGPQMYHTSHHPLDPSPSGGGPIAIAPNSGVRSGGEGSPLHQPPTQIPPSAGSPLAGKPGPSPTSHSTPPPPPYTRAIPPPMHQQVPPPLIRFPLQSADGVGPNGTPQVRHPQSQFPPSTTAGNHLQQAQPSPPPHQGRSPAPGNFSPYHPPPPPNYHYGAYPPPPPLAAADDALPPSAYQGSPYPDHYASPDATHSLQASDGSNSKSYDEEGGGEFGGLVSYFSSQREDDLDT